MADIKEIIKESEEKIKGYQQIIDVKLEDIDYYQSKIESEKRIINDMKKYKLYNIRVYKESRLLKTWDEYITDSNCQNRMQELYHVYSQNDEEQLIKKIPMSEYVVDLKGKYYITAERYIEE